MPNIIDILARALSLRQETALNSITPNRAGGIMYDTLLVLNQMQLEGGSLLISKVYASVSAMEADTTPTSDLTGRALKPGQLVVIVTSDTSSSDMGSEYRYNGPGSWTYVGKVGGLPLDTVPTQSSTKGITSGGVYAALAAMKAEGYKYMGIATPGAGGTAPGTPNQPVFYIAGPGSYPNFGSITVASGYLGFIKYSGGSWSVESVAVGKDYDAQISALDGQISQLRHEVNEIHGERTVPDVFTFPGVDGVISFDPIQIKDDGDSLEIDLLTTITTSEPNKGFAFAMNGTTRALGVSPTVLSGMNSSGVWLDGMNGGTGQKNIASYQINLNSRAVIKYAKEGTDLKIYAKGTLVHTISDFSSTIQIDRLGGVYTTGGNNYYWAGKIFGLQYTHGGITRQIYDLPGFLTGGDVSYTTKHIEGGLLDDLQRDVDGVVVGLEELKSKTLSIGGGVEREVTAIAQVSGVVSEPGYNASPENTTKINISALSGFDSYYFYLTKDADVWVVNGGQAYLSMCYVIGAQPISNNSISGTSAARKRNVDNNLPTEQSPISLSAGDAVVITVTAGLSADVGFKVSVDTFNGDTPLAPKHIDQVLSAIPGISEKAEMYFSKSASQLNVFQKLSNGQYIHYPFDKRYKAFTANQYPSYYDNWGNGQVALADLSGGAMVDNANLFAIGEAELAISVPSGLDASENKYVGGNAHGFENIVTGDNGREVSILVNNQKVAEDAVISLTPVEKVEVIQHTKLCQAYTNSNPWADITKLWVWEKGKMSCTSSVKILRALTIAYSQFGMFCVYRHWLGNDNNNYLTNKAVKNNLPYKVWNVEDGWSASGLSLPDKDCTRIVEYGEREIGFSMSIKSETTKTSGGMFIGPPAADYNKIYFDMGRSFTPSVDEVLEATQTWEIYK